MDDHLNRPDFRSATPPAPAGAGDAPPQDLAAAPVPAGQGAPGKGGASGNLPAKALAGCGIAFLVIQLAVVFAGIISLASCMRSCSDDPIRDDAATLAFIADRDATARDLETFDALRGKFDSLWDVYTSPNSARSLVPSMSVDELRGCIAAGSWPEDGAGFGDVETPVSPQLWVRLAELAEDHIERETGADWQIVDFEYPFPNNGPIPVPPKRGEASSVVTRLLCTSGQDEGLIVTVRHMRWARPVTFEMNLDEARERASEALQRASELEASGILGGRDYILDPYGDLLVWASDADDPLAEDAAFLEFAESCLPHLRDYGEVILLAPDAPAIVSFDPLGDYPNVRPDEEVSREEARRMLLLNPWSYDFEPEHADELISVRVRDGAIDPETLSRRVTDNAA